MRLGVMIRAQHPPETVPALAREAERDGFEELWLAEDCFLSGGPTLAVAALAATGRLRVGIGLLPAAVRNPAIVAMELATIARLHPGRLSVAFGHGIEAWMRQIGARPPDRIVALAETVAAVRTLLAGEEVSGAGLEAVRLDFPPPTVPPVLVGSTGPRGLAVASDGILLPEGAGPAAVRWARAQADPGQTVVYAWLSIAGDEATALAALRPRRRGVGGERPLPAAGRARRDRARCTGRRRGDPRDGGRRRPGGLRGRGDGVPRRGRRQPGPDPAARRARAAAAPLRRRGHVRGAWPPVTVPG